MSGMTHQALRSGDGTIRVWLYGRRSGWKSAGAVAAQLLKATETLTQESRADNYYVFGYLDEIAPTR